MLLATVALGLTACDPVEPTSYTIPKEERSVAIPGQEAPPAPAQSGPAKMEPLPGMAEAAEAAPDFTYTVPEGWEEFPPESVRKANFRVSDENGSVEIAVTVFPGDVGGKLANINRWRSQIGLEPTDLSGMRDVTRPFPISNHNGMLVQLYGPEQSIIGGILSFHRTTWFFKMQGTTGAVVAQAAAMEAFLSSVGIEDHHH